jgi:small nuclear ribonucleoprotein (snRNP)-like protein
MCNSLISIIKACEGRKTQIDLRNEANVYGLVDYVHAEMNIVMSDAVFTNLKGVKKFYKHLSIRGNNIRFVHIPDSVDIINAVRNKINSIRHRKPAKRYQPRKTVAS